MVFNFSTQPRTASRAAVLSPPPPHDPSERELALVLEGWEVRLFGGRMFQYFVTRGLWHLQLWNEARGVSILTPSRLTRGCYEAYPIEGWKARVTGYEQVAALISDAHGASLPSFGALAKLKKALVDDVVRGAVLPARMAQ